MSFSKDLRRFNEELDRRNRDVLAGTVAAVHESITEGSPITGAPGQPVQSGELKSSWQPIFESEAVAVVATDKPYARSIEDGISYAHGGTPMQQRSPVGGFHSVKLTIAGFERLVANVVSRVTRR